jgi:hypothetical protein
VPFGECTPAMLDRARAHLHQIDLVGLTERFAASLLLFGRALEWRHLGFRPLNRSLNRSHPDRLDASARDALIALNRFDLELYAEARPV